MQGDKLVPRVSTPAEAALAPAEPAPAVPAPAPPAPAVAIVIKHHLLVRVTHWLNVPLLTGLIASGLAIYWAAPVYGRLPAWVYDHLSLGTGQLAIALRLHWFFAYLFMANGALYLVGLLAGGGYKALLPRFSDIPEALAMMRYYLGLIPARIRRKEWPHPAVTRKYNALQRAGYFSIPVFGTLAILSGWAMHKPVQLPWLERLFVSYDGARVVHFWIMILFAAFVVPHVVLAIADGWDTLRSIVTGWSARTGDGHH